MSTPKNSSPNISQTSGYSKQSYHDLCDDCMDQQKTSGGGQDNAPTSSVPKGAVGLLDLMESLKEKMFPEDVIENWPEPGRQRLKELFPILEKHIAESRQVYADLADNPSSQSVARRRMMLAHEMERPGGILSQFAEIGTLLRRNQ